MAIGMQSLDVEDLGEGRLASTSAEQIAHGKAASVLASYKSVGRSTSRDYALRIAKGEVAAGAPSAAALQIEAE